MVCEKLGPAPGREGRKKRNGIKARGKSYAKHQHGERKKEINMAENQSVTRFTRNATNMDGKGAEANVWNPLYQKHFFDTDSQAERYLNHTSHLRTQNDSSLVRLEMNGARSTSIQSGGTRDSRMYKSE